MQAVLFSLREDTAMRVIDEQSLTERQRYWLKHLRSCKAVGVTMQAYASEHGIDVRSLYGAKKRLVKRGVLATEKRSGGVEFSRARVVVGAAPGSDCRVQFPNGITVTFSATVGLPILRR